MDGCIPGIVIDDHNLVTGTQRLQSSANLVGIVAGMKDGSDGRHRRMAMKA
jgi:hypothetical protein